MHLVSVSSLVLWSQVCFDAFTLRAAYAQGLRFKLCRRCCPSTIWLCTIKVIGSELRSIPSRGMPNWAQTNWYVVSTRHRIASTTWGDVNINRAKESWAPEPKVQGGYAPFFNRKNGRDQFRVFLIIKLAIFVYFSLTSTLLWSASLWGPHSSSADTHRERRVESFDWASAFVASSTGSAKKAHWPLSTSPAQTPQNQHNGPPDKVGGNKEERNRGMVSGEMSFFRLMKWSLI